MISTKLEKDTEGRVVVLGFLLAAIMAACVLLAANPAHAATFTVNSTGDAPDANLANGVCDVNASQRGNQCTLRAAIQEVNAAPGPHTINFNIPSSIANKCSPSTNVCTISPTSSLPNITEPVIIDGYTQPGASANTLAVGDNAVLRIRLDGRAAGGPTTGTGLNIAANDSVVRGLSVTRFFGGIGLSGADNNRIVGNFLGTDPGGTQDLGNGFGLYLQHHLNNSSNGSSHNIVGGTSPEDRNLISGNDSFGVLLLSGSSGNTIQGNLIGTDKNGGALGNGDEGVMLAAAGTGNRILSNSIFSNGGLGIDLEWRCSNCGVTPNDPQDPDTGPNNLQNYPIITSATTSGTATTINSKLNSIPNTTFTIQFFSSPAADPSGFGEGKKFLGEKRVITDGSGNTGTFTFGPDQTVRVGHFVTATATRNPATRTRTGDTSEFSKARVVEPPPIGGG